MISIEKRTDAEINVEVDICAIKERLKYLSSKTDSIILPVIKNNCNGIGFKESFRIFEECGIKSMAAAYAREFLVNGDYIKNSDMEKIAWTWFPNDQYKEVNNLVLVCKNFNQLTFCLENDIRFHLAFDFIMNRGGFKKENVKDILFHLEKHNYNGEIIFTSHNPFEDSNNINKYIEGVHEYMEDLKNMGLKIDDFHISNSITFKELMNNNDFVDKKIIGRYIRAGEVLLLPQKGTKYDPINVSTYVASEVMSLCKGDHVGYNAYTLDKEAKCVVIPVGYYNFEKIDYVIVQKRNKNYKCKVLNMMHDSAIVDVSNVKDIELGDKVYLICNELLEDNWNKCIQRTCKFNKDLAKYYYI